MEVVDLLDLIYIKDVLEALQDVDGLGRGLHQDRHAVAENWDCCEDTNNCEYHCCYGISNLSLREEVNDQSSDNDSNTLDYITYDVNNGSSNVHIFVIVARMTVTTSETMAAPTAAMTVTLFLATLVFMLVIMIVILVVIMRALFAIFMIRFMGLLLFNLVRFLFL